MKKVLICNFLQIIQYRYKTKHKGKNQSCLLMFSVYCYILELEQVYLLGFFLSSGGTTAVSDVLQIEKIIMRRIIIFIMYTHTHTQIN